MAKVEKRGVERAKPMACPEHSRRARPGEEATPDLPPYEPPVVITYHREELLEELGPAQACSFSGSVVSC